MDLKERKIRVNAVGPGIIPTPGYNTGMKMTQEQVDQFLQGSIGNIPLGRPGTTDEIAKAVLFLASDDSSYVNVSSCSSMVAWLRSNQSACTLTRRAAWTGSIRRRLNHGRRRE